MLILSERLKSLTAAFDRLRSLRYQQLQQQEANRLRRLPQQLPPGLTSPPRPVQPQQPPQQAQPPGPQPQTTGEFHSLLSSQQQQQQQQRGAPPMQQPPLQLPRPGGMGATAGATAGAQQQQQALMDPENKALQLELTSMSEQVGLP